MECRPVRAYSELCAAFRMVHDNYVASGYMTPHPSGMRYTALQLLPVSTTWIAIYGNEIIGTGTVVAYSPAGLPSGAVFADHFRTLRSKGRTVAEATLLACRSHHEVNAVSIICAILRHGVRCSRVDDFCVVADPNHLSFWQKVLGFEILTNARRDGHAAGHPGVLMRLDLRGIACGARQPTKGYKKFILQPLDDEEIEEKPFRLSSNQIRGLIELRPQILAEATPAQWELLQEYVGVTRTCSLRFSSQFSRVA